MGPDSRSLTNAVANRTYFVLIVVGLSACGAPHRIIQQCGVPPFDELMVQDKRQPYILRVFGTNLRDASVK